MIELRLADGERDFRAIFALLMIQFAEVGRNALNPEKTGKAVADCMRDGAAYLIEKDGEPIGTLGVYFGGYWYSDAKVLREQWLWIAPPYRDGSALRAVFAELKRLAEITGLSVELKIFNEKQHDRRTALARIGEEYSFVPSGVGVIINPPAGGLES